MATEAGVEGRCGQWPRLHQPEGSGASDPGKVTRGLRDSGWSPVVTGSVAVGSPGAVFLAWVESVAVAPWPPGLASVMAESAVPGSRSCGVCIHQGSQCQSHLRLSPPLHPPVFSASAPILPINSIPTWAGWSLAPLWGGSCLDLDLAVTHRGPLPLLPPGQRLRASVLPEGPALCPPPGQLLTSSLWAHPIPASHLLGSHPPSGPSQTPSPKLP